MESSDPRIGAPETWGPETQRVVRWHDPRATVMLAAQRSGHDYLLATLARKLPASPISRLLNIEPVSIAHGDVLFRSTPDESFYNPMGIVHGGFMCTMLDAATASAVHSTLPAGVGFTTIEIKVNYLASVHAGDAIVAHGWLTKAGSRICFAEADLRNQVGKVVATASSSILLIRQ